MALRIALTSLCFIVACGDSSSFQRLVPMPVAPTSSAPVTTRTQSQPLEGTPFVPTLSGHRLALFDDYAVVSDPEGPGEDGVQPQVHIVSLGQKRLLASLNLPKGSNPQAVAATKDGYAYVVLEGLGGVVAVNLPGQILGAFTKVCPAPADIAARQNDVLVACRSGEVITLTDQGLQTQIIAPNLSRIAVDEMGNVFVATQAAELIKVGVSGPVAPAPVALIGGGRVAQANSPNRLVPMPGGGVAMLFQQSLSGELTQDFETMSTTTTTTTVVPGGGYSGDTTVTTTDTTTTIIMCKTPATRPATTTSDVDGKLRPTRWAPGTLITDAAVLPSGKTLAVVDPAGGGVRFQPLEAPASDDTCDPSQPTSPMGSDGYPTGPQIPVKMPTAIGVVNHTINGDMPLVILNADPLELQLVGTSVPIQEGSGVPTAQTIPIRSRSLSEGFKLFHAQPVPLTESDPSAPPGAPNPLSISCASCHPNGMNNGATTTVFGLTHRVMPLAGHLKTAARVHWDGQDFHTDVIEGTWHTNMRGPELTPSQEQSLRQYIGQLKMPTGLSGDPTQLAAGRQAFTKAGCDQCHSPQNAYTNDGVADVGHGMHKVPSLIGVAYTAPYMSTGCALTLEQRFDDDACGGGAQHGDVASLSADERAALIAFLKTL
jgi:hypothetical protein